MGKIPLVERDGVGNGVRGESAIQWYEFLAEEADLAGRPMEYSMWKAKSENVSLAHVCIIYDKKLEEEITKWMQKKR
jgi:hypothetical protein